jgi:hypothetical protein
MILRSECSSYSMTCEKSFRIWTHVFFIPCFSCWEVYSLMFINRSICRYSIVLGNIFVYICNLFNLENIMYI